MIERISDIGNIRELNEDTFGVLEGKYFNLFIICDGMGGHNAGEVASKMAKDTILEAMEHDLHESPVEALVSAIKEANRKIFERSSSEKTMSGMGTTVTTAVSYDGKLDIAHVGDSSLYIIRGNEIRKITKDHSYVQELVDSGKIRQNDARHHPNKNIITRAVGTNADVAVDTYRLNTEKDDIFVLCTDGLTDYLSDEEILNEVTSHENKKDSIASLADIAKERGGKDNITLVIFGGEALK
ncbi:Stp1/IreP family PP2C-type Ser/Thr phosphatase [Proteiniclasticum sp. C24MP]|uniref:Stp1/IreP family PP2C-type Ser/Thr phosphatase n=1 Tax=Proteiniclasticum sp. C24MP TaxID=3374101 RepID=UPI003754990C